MGARFAAKMQKKRTTEAQRTRRGLFGSNDLVIPAHGSALRAARRAGFWTVRPSGMAESCQRCTSAGIQFAARRDDLVSIVSPSKS
jgi:hypothetical protein